jgi:hypothetical protein
MLTVYNRTATMVMPALTVTAGSVLQITFADANIVHHDSEALTISQNSIFVSTFSHSGSAREKMAPV